MLRIIFIIFACVLLTQGCDPDSTGVMSEQEKNAIAKAVEKRVSDYVESMKKLDLKEMLSFWAETENFVKAGDGSLVVGYDKIAAKQRENLSKVTSVDSVKVKNSHVYVLCKNAVSYSFEFEWSMTLKSGDIKKSRGSWTYVFKKFNGEWKVVHSAGTHLYN